MRHNNYKKSIYKRPIKYKVTIKRTLNNYTMKQTNQCQNGINTPHRQDTNLDHKQAYFTNKQKKTKKRKLKSEQTKKATKLKSANKK